MKYRIVLIWFILGMVQVWAQEPTWDEIETMQSTYGLDQTDEVGCSEFKQLAEDEGYTVQEIYSPITSDKLTPNSVLIMVDPFMLIEPEEFDSLLERIEYLEDLVDGRQAVAEYLEDPAVALDAEEVFERMGQ